MGHPVVHLVSFSLTGEHVLNPSSEHARDCWCEPHAGWFRNKWGVLILVVEHDDEHIAEEWISHALADPDHYPAAPHRDIPRRWLLPPHEKGPEE